MVGFDENGRIVLRRRVRRSWLLAETVNLPPCLIGMEACGGFHHHGLPFPRRNPIPFPSGFSCHFLREAYFLS